jgi:hypothetical protein
MWWARLLNVISGLLSGGAAPAAATSYESIATVNLTGTQTTVTFSSIPSTFKHLQIRANIRGAGGAWNFLTFNGDATQSNYYAHELAGNGSSAYANAYAGGASPKGIQLFVTYGFSNIFTGAVIDILDYTSTNKAKTVRCLSGWDGNSTTPSGEVRLTSGLWSATPAAITSLSLVTNGGDYQNYSSFALYGIKG